MTLLVEPVARPADQPTAALPGIREASQQPREVVPFLNLRAINERHRAAFREAFERVMDSGWVLLGEQTEAFEQAFAAYCGVKHCISVGNGLDALQLALRGWGIGHGDEVIVPSHTYIATWLAVSYTGATPVPVEPKPGSYDIDPAQVEAAITSRTKAVLAVHLYGRPADMRVLRALAARRGIHLLEDAAQAHGARRDGKRCGNLGDAAGFSFYPGKNLGALGDAGAVTTNDDQLAKRVRMLRNYGSDKKYVHDLRGFNSRMDELQAAFLLEKLKVLDDDNRRRREIAERYGQALADLPDLVLPPLDEGEGIVPAEPWSGWETASSGQLSASADKGIQSAWHLFVVRHRERDRLAEKLVQHGVHTLIHYPTPVHHQKAYQDDPVSQLHLPLAVQYARELLSLPIDPTMSDAQVQQVIDATRAAVLSL
ncbi:MAG: DegT/DnrJ/EryC1/StrS family aminotransferase [Lautropia sp.]|nr:DegT/DnrJ/EryC1/StrS family aminotransferase [Lautropia sp.]